jgi:hypothetical protein
MDVGGRLRNPGLGQYETAFGANRIDFSVLPDMTDLEKLGVLLGHRRKLLCAIADFENLKKVLPSAVADVVARLLKTHTIEMLVRFWPIHERRVV